MNEFIDAQNNLISFIYDATVVLDNMDNFEVNDVNLQIIDVIDKLSTIIKRMGDTVVLDNISTQEEGEIDANIRENE